jgi:hypothetical protein
MSGLPFFIVMARYRRLSLNDFVWIGWRSGKGVRTVESGDTGGGKGFTFQAGVAFLGRGLSLRSATSQMTGHVERRAYTDFQRQSKRKAVQNRHFKGWRA